MPVCGGLGLPRERGPRWNDVANCGRPAVARLRADSEAGGGARQPNLMVHDAALEVARLAGEARALQS